MHAAWFEGSGGPEVIGFREVPRPVAGAREVVVRVEAAGLNRADLLQRRGAYPAPAGWPEHVPGLEYAGVVESLGEGVRRWRPGDRVMGLVGGGAMAEAVAVHEDEVLAVPRHLSSADAAAIPEAFLTAYDALVRRARLRPGERVLLHAAGSGVGSAAVQLCRLLRLRAVGTSRSAAKLARLVPLGLEEAIDTSRGGFREQLSEPVDAVIDVLGGPALADNLAVLRPRGRLVILGFLLGTRAEADLGLVLRNRLEIVGTALRSRGLGERIPLVAEFAARVLPHFGADEPEATRLVPILDRVLPMASLPEAHRLMEANDTFGKVVLSWGGAARAG
ncbi:MAG: NAD(P)H-quinone oxidoreductase [Gemmatimonadales bacterium]|jgi:putative PIG3 family NAD(P)H quinone oxidoreductase|nr:NAD(P)H-quinone oxidoreductase [Gemmatimonadales bacterium]